MNNRSITYIAIFLMAFGSGLSAQTDDWRAMPKKETATQKTVVKPASPALPYKDTLPKPGTVNIHQSERIESLVNTFDAAEKTLHGFRIQIFLGKAKEAQAARTKFISEHSDLPAYAIWQSPNMKVRVGDFRTRLDAERALREVRKQHPGAYIVKDEIELPALDTIMD